MEKLIGFEDIRKSLQQLFTENKLHHAILISGSKSIGKATFAKDFVHETLLSQSQNQLQIQNHPDLLLIEKTETNKNITVDQIRQINSFITKTPSIAKVKFIIIDAADDLNQSSANALLKILEEPLANNFLILINHNLGRILPTIKSRCLLIKAKDLPFEDFQQIISQNDKMIDKDELQFLALLTSNSAAESLKFKEQTSLQINDIYQKFLNSIKKKQIDDFFIKNTPKEITSENLNTIFTKITNFFLQRLIYFTFNMENKIYFHGENEAFAAFTMQKSQNRILDLCDEIKTLSEKNKSLNLDTKQSISNIFNLIFYG